MGEMLITIVIIVNLIFLFLYFVIPKNKRRSFPGKEEDIFRYLNTLEKSDLSDAYLIISASKTDNFVQVTVNSEGFRLNVPRIPDRQKEMEKSFRNTAEKLSLKIDEDAFTDDKNSFPGVDLKGSLEEVSAVIKKVLSGMYGVTEGSALEFEINA